MTTLDAAKLKRILTQVSAYNGTANLEMAQAIWAAAQAEQREDGAAL